MVSFLFGVFLTKFYFNRWFPFDEEKTNFLFFSSFFARVNYVPLSNEEKEENICCNPVPCRRERAARTLKLPISMFLFLALYFCRPHYYLLI